jgi:hypothetical protein
LQAGPIVSVVPSHGEMIPLSVVQETVSTIARNPSSVVPSQSSSAPLHASTPAHALQLHEPEQLRAPVVPQVVEHAPVAPNTHSKPSSGAPSQSSSSPLHVSDGPAQAPQVQPVPHVRAPVPPHGGVQAVVEPCTHSKPSSAAPSQSSSRPLHDSAGGPQAPQVQEPEQAWVPIEPHEVEQVPVAPEAHSKPSSAIPSQSSSSPLQVSAGAAQGPQPHAASHPRVPAEPHVVTQEPLVPGEQAKPSSGTASQSSSSPLHDSGGGRHPAPAGGSQAGEHAPAPLVPQLVVHGVERPTAHGNPSSVVPSQSSSTPLHTSGAPDGVQAYSHPGAPSRSCHPARQERMHADSSQAPSALSASVHALSQLPQCSRLLVGSTHSESQAIRPPPHVPVHVPSLHTSIGPHACPHPPQFVESVVRSAHPVGHGVRPGGQAPSGRTSAASSPPTPSSRPTSAVPVSSLVAHPAAATPSANTAQQPRRRPVRMFRPSRGS